MSRRTGPGRVALLVPGIVCIGLAAAVGVPLLSWVATQDAWAARESARPLTEEHERVELLLDGRSLELALSEGLLRRADGSPLAASELLVRFNDIERVRQVRVALCAALAAAGAVFVGIGLFMPAVQRDDDD